MVGDIFISQTFLLRVGVEGFGAKTWNNSSNERRVIKTCLRAQVNEAGEGEN